MNLTLSDFVAKAKAIDPVGWVDLSTKLYDHYLLERIIQTVRMEKIAEAERAKFREEQDKK